MFNNNKKELDQSLIDDLVRKSQSGDSEAFAKLYDLLVDYIYRYLYFRVDKENLEDLIETVFIKVWENLHRYQKGIGSFLAWVYRITHNLLVDHYRTHRPLQELKTDIADDRQDTDPKYLMERKINDYNLRKALNKLKDSYKQILILRFISDLTIAETAAVLACKERMVRVTQFRALQALKKILLEMGVKYV